MEPLERRLRYSEVGRVGPWSDKIRVLVRRQRDPEDLSLSPRAQGGQDTARRQPSPSQKRGLTRSQPCQRLDPGGLASRAKRRNVCCARTGLCSLVAAAPWMGGGLGPRGCWQYDAPTHRCSRKWNTCFCFPTVTRAQPVLEAAGLSPDTLRPDGEWGTAGHRLPGRPGEGCSTHIRGCGSRLDHEAGRVDEGACACARVCVCACVRMAFPRALGVVQRKSRTSPG